MKTQNSYRNIYYIIKQRPKNIRKARNKQNKTKNRKEVGGLKYMLMKYYIKMKVHKIEGQRGKICL